MIEISAERRSMLSEAGRRGGSRPKKRWTDEEREFVRTRYRGTLASCAAIGAGLKQGD